jgi:hypothetical protein
MVPEADTQFSGGPGGADVYQRQGSHSCQLHSTATRHTARFRHGRNTPCAAVIASLPSPYCRVFTGKARFEAACGRLVPTADRWSTTRVRSVLSAIIVAEARKLCEVGPRSLVLPRNDGNRLCRTADQGAPHKSPRGTLAVFWRWFFGRVAAAWRWGELAARLQTVRPPYPIRAAARTGVALMAQAAAFCPYVRCHSRATAARR